MKKQAEGNPGAEEKQTFFDKQQQQIYNILTGKIRYKPQPFREDDLKPDLVIKMKVPKQPYIARGSYLSLSSFITSPSQKLQRVYSRAEKEIAKEMETNKENVDPLNIRMRMQLSLNTIQPQTKQTLLINDHEEEEILEFECINSLNGILDAFTIQYNCIVYTLQQVCGFRVKSFVLYDKHVEQRYIYLFLTISTENLLRVANKYRIKKEVDYTFFDFYLNDPTTKDERPIKLNSKFKSDKYNATQQKHLSRYFRVNEGEAKDEEIIQERELNDEQLENFRSCNEELHILYEYIKYKQGSKLTSNEKTYLFEHNRRKINPGVEKLYAIMKKRREYFDISKEILPKYGYTVWEEPTVFEEFSLPDKNSKGATFFNKFESIMLYKPLTVSKDGGLSLFLNMERTKLSYMLIKQNFKVSYLAKIGTDIFTLENEFQKFGNEGRGEIKGGIDNQNLVDNWNAYSLFSDMKVIRNYMGERIAYEVLYNNYIFGYMLSIITPYSILYALELAFADEVYTGTSFAEAILFSVTYSIFLVEWQNKEGQFVKNYCDSVESKIFLSKFRGPYKRNVITDQASEFQNTPGMGSYIKNLVCFLLIGVLLVILGAIFHGFRMMILQIYDPLQDYVNHMVSLPHIIGYLLFFVFEEAFRFLLADKIIAFMVFLQNPPSDEDERRWSDTLTFFYLLAIELIPPFFLLIIEPFTGTSCYSNRCEDELVFYIYSRYLIMLAIVIFKLGYVLIFRYIRKNLKLLMKKEKPPQVFYQDRLADLLKRAMGDCKKDEHKEEKMGNIINLQNYAIYCTQLPLSPVIMCLAVFIHFTSMRLSLIFEQRRPLNRSESVILFSGQLKYIYYIGITLNSWINVFLFELVELNLQNVIEAFSTDVNEQGVFLVKLLVTFIYAVIMMICGNIVSGFVKSYSTDAVNARKDNKFHQYKTSRGGLKIILKKGEDMIPLKSVFRVFNPERSASELLNEAVYEQIIEMHELALAKEAVSAVEGEGENMGSATHLEK